MKEINVTAKLTKSQKLSSQRTEQDGYDIETFVVNGFQNNLL
jgi:hypothetical protein